MRKNKLLLLLALLMTAATGAWAQEVIPVTLDFTSNTWGIPAGSEEKTAAENSYTSGGYTITLCGSSGNGYYFSLTEPYILLGKQGAYLQLPAFSSAVDSIKVVGTSSASTAVEQNIYVGDVAVSTATTGMKNVTQKYVIEENYRTAGTIYRIKVTSANNTQIKKVLVYFTPAPATYTVSMKDGVKDADKWTVKVGDGQAQALPIGGLKGDGSETVTLQYNGRLKVKGVKATSDAAPAAVSYTLLSAATTADVGKVVCAAGHLHDAKTAVPDGCTAVGILGKVTETGHGLILALQNATSQNWNTINGWTSVTTYAGTTLKVLPDDAARGSLTSYTKLGETAVSNWAVAQKSDYEAIFTNLGSATGDPKSYDDNVNAYITTGVGGTAMSAYYWSASLDEDGFGWLFWDPYWNGGNKANSRNVRPVLGF